jgi:hypothetical protein
MLALTHGDEKANANSAHKKQPQNNSSYKVQRLHAAVLLQGGTNRLRSLVADFVAVLQNSCWPSRTAIKNNKSHQVQSLHSDDFARCHACSKRNAIRI